MKRILLVSSLLLLVVATAYAGTVSLTPCNGCLDDAINIQQAIAVASQNGTVPGTVILSGYFTTLTEIVVAVPNVTLQASRQSATLDASAAPRAAIELFTGADNFAVRGLTIIGYRGVIFAAGDGLPVNNVVVENNTMYNNWRNVVQWYSYPSSTGWVVRHNQMSCNYQPDPNLPPKVDCTLLPTGVLMAGAQSTIQDNVITGLTIQDGEIVGWYSFGILLENPADQPTAASNIKVQDNTLEGVLAIGIYSGSSNLVARNKASTPTCDGVSILPNVYFDDYGVVIGYGQPANSNQVVNNEMTNMCDSGVFLAAGSSNNSIVNNNLSMNGPWYDVINVGYNWGDVNGILPPATKNQIHANQIAGGAVGVFLDTTTLKNVVTGNKISTENPPLVGIVDNGTGNIVNGNPGFNPVTGHGSLHGPKAHGLIKP
jgi:hypothetical protein